MSKNDPIIGVLLNSIGNVLRRKRSERLGLQQQYEDACRKHETPRKGLGSDIHCLDVEIKTLEEVLAEILKG